MSFEDFKREALDKEEDTAATESELPDEVRRRYQAIKEGKTKLLSGKEVFAELRAEAD